MSTTSAQGILLTFASIVGGAEGRLKCTETSLCEAAMRPGSVCEGGFCSNPFQRGCLRGRLGAGQRRRVCNSDDPGGAAGGGLCDPPPFDYGEVRIQNQDWPGPMISSWVMQILLSELLRVPTSIETSSPDRHYNFYDPQGRVDTSTEIYHFPSLYTAAEVGDCREVKLKGQDTGEYKSCANVFPMVSETGRADDIQKLRDEGIISQPKHSGNADQYRWWVPKIFAQQHPALLNHFGLGSVARPELAELLKRPTDWGTYCEYVSATNCEKEDAIAARAPEGDEAKMYFSPGLYTGHFRATEKNDCTANPDTCTGHITNTPCSWSNYAVAQAYHNDIHVESDGNEPPHGGYSYSSLMEIYEAANATGSNVILNWWEPDPFIERFEGTDFEMVPIHLLPTTLKCLKNRVTPEGRCSANFTEQVGSPEGACDTGPVSNMMLMSLDECSPSEDASCSPAFSALQRYEITNLDLQQIYQYGIRDQNKDDREAVCRWFVENLDAIKQKFVPHTYPRQQHEGAFYQPFSYFTITLAVLAMIFVPICACLSKFYKKTKVMIYAQVDFLLIILSGLFLVTVAAVLYSLAPTKAVCISRQWFIAVGYSLELMPLAVKVAAINRIFHQSRRCKRVEVKKRRLYQHVVGCIVAICIFLAVWTGVDPPIPHAEMELMDESEGDNYVVEVLSTCASSSDGWQIGLSMYLVVLLLVAAAIATQNRDIKQEFNESRYMALIIYSHLIFTLLRLVIFLLRDRLGAPAAVSAAVSLLLSMDVLITIGIYFLPKLVTARKTAREKCRRSTATVRRPPEPATRRRSSLGESDPASFTWNVPRRRSSIQNDHKLAGSAVHEGTQGTNAPQSRRLSLEKADPQSFSWALPHTDTTMADESSPDNTDSNNLAGSAVHGGTQGKNDPQSRRLSLEKTDPKSFSWAVPHTETTIGDDTFLENTDSNHSAMHEATQETTTLQPENEPEVPGPLEEEANELLKPIEEMGGKDKGTLKKIWSVLEMVIWEDF